MQSKNIVIIATLDTRGKAVEYLRDHIRERGHNPIVIDVCTALKSPPFEPDITHEKVAEAIGKSIEEVASQKVVDAISVMAEGASNIVQRLLSNGKLDGIIGLGGSVGTSLGLEVMKNLPVNIPKLMLSTISFTSLITPKSVAMDQVMMQTITHSCGADPITEMVLERAAGAICGMVETKRKGNGRKPIIAITTLGASSFDFADYCTEMLLEKGYEPAVFHSIGMNTCERLIRQGYISGLLDFSMSEIASCVGGGIYPGEEKLVVACEEGIPQVVAPGAISFFDWIGAMDTLPPKFRNRKIQRLNSLLTMVSISKEEKIRIAKLMAERLNKAKGPVALLIPLRGFSKWEDKDGTPFYDPDSRKRFIEVLRETLNPDVVKFIELDISINDPVFSEKAVMLLDEMMKSTFY